MAHLPPRLFPMKPVSSMGTNHESMYVDYIVSGRDKDYNGNEWFCLHISEMLHEWIIEQDKNLWRNRAINIWDFKIRPFRKVDVHEDLFLVIKLKYKG